MLCLILLMVLMIIPVSAWGYEAVFQSIGQLSMWDDSLPVMTGVALEKGSLIITMDRELPAGSMLWAGIGEIGEDAQPLLLAVKTDTPAVPLSAEIESDVGVMLHGEEGGLVLRLTLPAVDGGWVMDTTRGRIVYDRLTLLYQLQAGGVLRRAKAPVVFSFSAAEQWGSALLYNGLTLSMAYGASGLQVTALTVDMANPYESGSVITLDFSRELQLWTQALPEGGKRTLYRDLRWDGGAVVRDAATDQAAEGDFEAVVRHIDSLWWQFVR